MTLSQSAALPLFAFIILALFVLVCSIVSRRSYSRGYDTAWVDKQIADAQAARERRDARSGRFVAVSKKRVPETKSN